MKRKRIKWHNVLLLLVLLFFVVLLIISIINIAKWNIERENVNKQVNNIEKVAKIGEKKDNKNVEIVTQTDIPSKSDPYWDYIGMNMLYVNFSELKNINNEVKGWLKVNGTTINYPFVQASNNDFYLTHSFDKSYNKAGWVFMDYRNDIKSLNKNTIIYAHGRLDNIMFGSLKNIVKSNWYNDKNNYVIKMSTEYENTLWQVISVYHIKTTSDYIETSFSSDKEYQNFLDMITKRSIFNFNTNANSNDHILTLSTCYNNDEKVVMHAKLIKRESIN